ncbi:hypothetical protein F441_20608 [Phytophthora nicotianae CJ01A1]|uniref:Uncharacterized protein n=1 Tax=Phytophthora nicotianae CJ01A1 TaxID=1317063 RepID=W2VVH0_PHYNI|nr:hypothetical protein F441_20608 [Phytophthora nicotianae CJ01A1]
MQLKMPVIQQLPLLERWKSTIRFLPDGPNSTLSNAVHQIPGRRGKATTFATTAPAERIYG